MRSYCIFNDLAICAEKALLQPEVSRVLILDLGVHQGDGTAKIFQDDERVYTVSLHGKNNFPFRKQISDWDLEFRNETGDAEYLNALDKVLDKLSEEDFDLIFFQAGVDGLASDRSVLDLSREGLKRETKASSHGARQWGVPMLLFMGGGYANPIDHSVDAFCDLFLAARKFGLRKRLG